MIISLEVTKRDSSVSVDQTTTIPGVVYGPKQESIPVSINRKVFEKLFADAGESTIISLEGLGEEIETLVQDVAFHPVKGGMSHVDFYAIERGKELTTNVPLQFEGEAPAEKDGGVLTKALHEVEVTCRPSNLPQNIIVDVSVLIDFETTIRVKDLPLPEDVKIGNDPEDTVATVAPVQEEVIEETAPEGDMDSIEVEQKGKDEDDSSEGEGEKKED